MPVLYEPLKSEIAADIRSGRYPVDSLLPPPQILAEESGYALTTTRRVSLTLDGIATGTAHHEVTIDPTAEAAVLAQYVLGAGHRDMAIWSGHHPNQRSTRQRMVGDRFGRRMALLKWSAASASDWPGG